MSFISKRNERRIAAYQRELIETHYAEVPADARLAA